jgi:putative transposase
MDIFRDQADYLFFLSRLKEYLYPDDHTRAPYTGAPSAGKARYVRKAFPSGSFTLVCYCLMPNHFHFVLRQNTEVPLSDLMLSLISGYSKYFNKKYGRVGSLFKDQFKSTRVDSNEYLLWLSAYVHQNPKVAGLVKNLSSYVYSSYPDYVGLRNGSLCVKDIVLEQFSSTEAYDVFVADSFDTIKGRKDLEYLLLD